MCVVCVCVWGGPDGVSCGPGAGFGGPGGVCFSLSSSSGLPLLLLSLQSPPGPPKQAPGPQKTPIGPSPHENYDPPTSIEGITVGTSIPYFAPEACPKSLRQSFRDSRLRGETF